MYRQRIIKVAASLASKYGNPDVFAFQRAKSAKTEILRDFWTQVGRSLYKPAGCQSWTNADIRTWDEIYAAQKATGHPHYRDR